MAKKTGKKKIDAAPENGPTATDAIKAAFERGSYAGVRKLVDALPAEASDADRAEAARLKSLVSLDPAQVMVGVGAVIVVLIVGILTLHT